jgi:hypothetical protein
VTWPPKTDGAARPFFGISSFIGKTAQFSFFVIFVVVVVVG